jgi:hypothetical protein
MIGRWECYWCKNREMFGIYTKCTKFNTQEDAHKELIEVASFHEPCHVIEIYHNEN